MLAGIFHAKTLQICVIFSQEIPARYFPCQHYENLQSNNSLCWHGIFHANALKICKVINAGSGPMSCFTSARYFPCQHYENLQSSTGIIQADGMLMIFHANALKICKVMSGNTE